MPSIRLSDSGLASVHARIGTALQVSDREFVTMLNELADATNMGSLPRDQRFSAISSRMNDAKREDLRQLLDETGLQFSKPARNFLEAVLGRAKLAADLQLSVSSATTQSISGTAPAGTIIEAINLSTAGIEGLRLVDTLDVGQSSSNGTYSIRMPVMNQGDKIRLRARSPDGSTTSEWFTANVDERGLFDQRAAFFDVKHVSMRAVKNGTVELVNSSIELPVGEPFAKMQVKNQRTGDVVSFDCDEKGQLPFKIIVPGSAGDFLSFATSDGTGNTNFSMTTGTLQVPTAIYGDIADPDVAAGHAALVSALDANSGLLFSNGLSIDDVVQGQLGDCYVPATLAAIVHTNPDMIRDIIRDNGDNTYSVRFFDKETLTPVTIVIDDDLYGRGNSLMYTKSSDKRELWSALIEKAYATWKGNSYQRITAGDAGSLLTELTGRETVENWTHSKDRYSNVYSPNDPDQLWAKLNAGLAQKRVIVGGTWSNPADPSVFNGTGVHANHAYSVMGSEVVDGERRILLRNPWGQGKNTPNGEFSLPFKDFVRVFQVMNIN